jgi:glycosyltransferase involved in cell wall biosynthesis
MVKNNSNHFVAPLRLKGKNPVYVLEKRLWEPNHRNVVFSLFQFIRLPGILNKYRINIVHSHLNASWVSAVALRWILRKKEIAYVFHEHDPNEVPEIVYRLILRLVYSTGILIAVSGAVIKRLKELGVVGERVKLAHNFVSPDMFSVLNNSEVRRHTFPNCREGDFVVGFAGRLVTRKGWKYFLDIAKTIKDENIKFVMVGSGPDGNKITQKIKALNLGGKVIFLGQERGMRRFYNGLDVFLVLAEEEPMGLVQLEAQACGTPVLAFDIPGMNETIGAGNALLIPPKDVEKMAEVIKRLKGDKALYDSLVAGGLENAKRFSIDKYMKNIEKLYEELLSGVINGK